MQTLILIGLFFCHLLADYTHLSTTWMLNAKKIGKPFIPIMVHAMVHALLMGIFLACFGISNVIWLMGFQFITHFVIDVWKDTFANYPPTVADTIAGSEKPTLSSQISNQDLNLTTWTTSVLAGDIIAFNVDSVSTVTKINLSIKLIR